MVTTKGLEPTIICVKGICPYLLDDVVKLRDKGRVKTVLYHVKLQLVVAYLPVLLLLFITDHIAE